jgi:uncharacterized protein
MNFSQIFENYTNIAVYGMSIHPTKAAHSVPAFMLSNGYTIIPINPKADFICGQKVYRNIMDIPDKIHILNVFRPSEDCLSVVQEAVERHKKKGDINLIWLQEGILNSEAKHLADENGIEFIQNKCMYKVYANT